MEICKHCNEEIDDLSANPSKWGYKNYHLECANKSANNYPIAIKLLKDLVQTIEDQENFLVEDAEEYENDYKLAKDFLKSVEDEE